MPLTAAEWLSENSEKQELAVMNIPLAMELYAAYVTSFVPDDVEKAIEQEYKDIEYVDGGLSKGSIRMHNEHMDKLRTSARYGASLAGRMEAVRFAEWAMNNNYMPDVIEKKHWLSDFDAPNGVEPYTTEQLYSLFKKESNG